MHQDKNHIKLQGRWKNTPKPAGYATPGICIRSQISSTLGAYALQISAVAGLSSLAPRSRCLSRGVRLK